MDETGYCHAIGVVRIWENSLLSQSVLKNLDGLNEITEFFNILKSTIYSRLRVDSFEIFSKSLEKIFQKKVETLIGVCPNNAPFNLLFLENDCLNLAELIIANFLKINLNFSNLKPNLFTTKLVEYEFNLLNLNEQLIEINASECLILFSKWLIEVLNSSSFNRIEIFNLIRKQIFKIKLNLALNNSFIFKRTQLEIDLTNFNLTVRALKLKVKAKILENSLIQGGSLNLDDILKAFLKGEKGLIKFFNLNFGLNLISLNLNFDDLKFKLISNFEFIQRNKPIGFAPIMGYLNQLFYEQQILRKVLIKLNRLKEL